MFEYGVKTLLISLALLVVTSFAQARSRQTAEQTTEQTTAQKFDQWPQLAERMTGESDRVHEQSLRDLRATPDLVKRLRAELRNPSQPSKTKMFLALDVISALKMSEMLPDLIELSETESSGYLYNTINTLVTPENRAQMIELYKDRVSRTKTPAPARMSLIDTLARFGVPLPLAQMSDLLKDPVSDLRKTALAHARVFLVRGLQPSYLPLVKEQLKGGSFLLRVQAIYLLRELESVRRLPVGAWREDCLSDLSETVRALCADRRRLR
jgi:HEAT repeat protein